MDVDECDFGSTLFQRVLSGDPSVNARGRNAAVGFMHPSMSKENLANIMSFLDGRDYAPCAIAHPYFIKNMKQERIIRQNAVFHTARLLELAVARRRNIFLTGVAGAGKVRHGHLVGEGSYKCDRFY